MEMSDKFRVPTALFPREHPRHKLDRRLDGTQTLCRRCGEEKNLLKLRHSDKSQTFRRNISHLSSGSKSKPSKKIAIVGREFLFWFVAKQKTPPLYCCIHCCVPIYRRRSRRKHHSALAVYRPLHINSRCLNCLFRGRCLVTTQHVVIWLKYTTVWVAT
jgi:hypothetical protein